MKRTVMRAMDPNADSRQFIATMKWLALISGCKSDQTSSDAVFGDRHEGALTHFLLEQLNTEDGLRIGLSTLVPRVTEQLAQAGYSQEPGVEGSPVLLAMPFLSAQRDVPVALPESIGPETPVEKLLAGI